MKYALTVCLAFLLPCMGLRGESEIRMRNIENRMDALEHPSNTQPTHHPITPCAGPKVREGMDLNLSASFLYWTARLDTLTYAKTGMTNLLANPSPNKGEVQSVNWTWDPGFKVALGWNFCHGCWDMILEYTWFYTNVGDSKRSQFLQPGFEILTPAFATTTIPNFEKAHAHYDLHYQVGDLEIGRNFYVSRSLKLRPFIGIKGTWQKQDYNVFYETLPLQVAMQQLLFNYSARFDHSVWGIGVRGGLNTSWQFSRIFSLYGNMAFSGLWLHYDTDRKDQFNLIDTTLPLTVERTTVNIQDHLRIIKPVIELAIGLRAETYFGCGRYHFLLQAGWETQIWLNQTLLISLNDHYDRFDLTLQGLTIKARFDF
ncbi:MAG: hypothetical protein KDK64_05035 [Chlamydiia bacterium]|nr:hypothetical protein [Chlamydiia bacterium]